MIKGYPMVPLFQETPLFWYPVDTLDTVDPDNSHRWVFPEYSGATAATPSYHPAIERWHFRRQVFKRKSLERWHRRDGDKDGDFMGNQ